MVLVYSGLFWLRHEIHACLKPERRRTDRRKISIHSTKYSPTQKTFRPLHYTVRFPEANNRNGSTQRGTWSRSNQSEIDHCAIIVVRVTSIRPACISSCTTELLVSCSCLVVFAVSANVVMLILLYLWLLYFLCFSLSTCFVQNSHLVVPKQNLVELKCRSLRHFSVM